MFQAAQEAAQELGLTISESAPDQSYFIAKCDVTGLDWGTLVGVSLTSVVDNAMLVIIRTDSKFAANIAGEDDTANLHAGIHRRLKAQ